MKVSVPPLCGFLSPKNLKIKRVIRTMAFWIFLISLSSSVSAQRVTGTVASKDSTLQGVTVSLKGTKISTQTGANGIFTLMHPLMEPLFLRLLVFSQ